MLNVLSSLISTVSALVTFLINSINGLITLISHIPTYVAFLTGSIGFLPAIFIPFATVYISLYALKFILGRQQ